MEKLFRLHHAALLVHVSHVSSARTHSVVHFIPLSSQDHSSDCYVVRETASGKPRVLQLRRTLNRLQLPLVADAPYLKVQHPSIAFETLKQRLAESSRRRFSVCRNDIDVRTWGRGRDLPVLSDRESRIVGAGAGF